MRLAVFEHARIRALLQQAVRLRDFEVSYELALFKVHLQAFLDLAEISYRQQRHIVVDVVALELLLQHLVYL